MSSANSVVTRTRRVSLAQVTSGKISTIPKITKMVFGDGGVGSNGDPIPPSDTQTALSHEVGRYNIENISYPVETTVRYMVTIPAEDLAGAAISEVGLLDAEDRLCAVKTMYSKRKDDDIKFVFEFDDEF